MVEALSWHPSKDITKTWGEELIRKKIILCVTGSAAAFYCPEIARRLMRHGAEVYAVMSSMSQKIIHPHLMEWATGNPPVTELTGRIEHISLLNQRGEQADIVLVAPATANTINKMASGVADGPVTALAHAALGAGIPIIVAPAMHQTLYVNTLTLENIEKLRGMGVELVGPRREEGIAKMANVEDIVEAVIYKLSDKDFSGLKFLVTAGPTREPIDPIRVISNRSSGKQGVALAYEARRRGAEVTLIYGPGAARAPSSIKVVSVDTTEEMFEATLSELRSTRYDVAIAAAAMADYTPEEPSAVKIQSATVKELGLRLRATPKLIDEVKRVSPETLLVAFKAEHNVSDEELVERGYERLKSSGADLIVVNDVARDGVGFQVETNEVFIVDGDRNVVHVPLSRKGKVAVEILNCVKKLLK